MTETVWEASLNKALTKHNTKLRWLKEDFARAEMELEIAKRKLEKFGLQMESEIEDSENDLKKILSRQEDPVVYVRSYNETTVYVYHGWLGCGRRPYPYRKMLLGEAQDAGLRPCVSCGHLATRPAAASREDVVMRTEA